MVNEYEMRLAEVSIIMYTFGCCRTLSVSVSCVCAFLFRAAVALLSAVDVVASTATDVADAMLWATVSIMFTTQ